jgi:hypothetical protein
MPEDPKQSGKADDVRINIDQDDEVKYWSRKFGVSEEEIRQAVKTAGPMIKDIRQKLASNRSY